MSYLQLTTKCQMRCSHCCFSCGTWGRHGKYEDIIQSMLWLRDKGHESIDIGGGEPTMHPDFFKILKQAMHFFQSVWMATNGGYTKKMLRIHDILQSEDYGTLEYGDDAIIPESSYHLTVALSQDLWHDKIDPRITRIWFSNKSSYNKRSPYEIRDVSQSTGLWNRGRTKKNQMSEQADESCRCGGPFITPDGAIKVCSCHNAPVIGHTRTGYTRNWLSFVEEEGNDCCWGLVEKSKKRKMDWLAPVGGDLMKKLNGPGLKEIKL